MLEYSSIDGEKVIPARFEPSFVPFVRSAEEMSDPSLFPSFGDTCCAYLLDDFRECHRLNLLRIATDPSKESYKASRLRIMAYYCNNVGQYFRSTYESYLGLREIPKDDEESKIHQIYVPRPTFHAEPISEDDMNEELRARNSKRHLSGW